MEYQPPTHNPFKPLLNQEDSDDAKKNTHKTSYRTPLTPQDKIAREFEPERKKKMRPAEKAKWDEERRKQHEKNEKLAREQQEKDRETEKKSQKEAKEKREFERHSGTGRGREISKNGAGGKGTWTGKDQYYEYQGDDDNNYYNDDYYRGKDNYTKNYGYNNYKAYDYGYDYGYNDTNYETGRNYQNQGKYYKNSNYYYNNRNRHYQEKEKEFTEPEGATTVAVEVEVGVEADGRREDTREKRSYKTAQKSYDNYYDGSYYKYKDYKEPQSYKAKEPVREEDAIHEDPVPKESDEKWETNKPQVQDPKTSKPRRRKDKADDAGKDEIQKELLLERPENCITLEEYLKSKAEKAASKQNEEPKSIVVDAKLVPSTEMKSKQDFNKTEANKKSKKKQPGKRQEKEDLDWAKMIKLQFDANAKIEIVKEVKIENSEFAVKKAKAEGYQESYQGKDYGRPYKSSGGYRKNYNNNQGGYDQGYY